MKNILVTLDFKENEQRLLDKAAQLAKPFNSKLWLLHIAAPDPDFVTYDVGPQYIRDSRASELREEHKKLKNYAEELKKDGIDAEGLLVQGATIEMILAESKKLAIDLIVSGHTEHGFFYNAFVGSVSAELIKQSKIPVLTVPLE